MPKDELDVTRSVTDLRSSFPLAKFGSRWIGLLPAAFKCDPGYSSVLSSKKVHLNFVLTRGTALQIVRERSSLGRCMHHHKHRLTKDFTIFSLCSSCDRRTPIFHVFFLDGAKSLKFVEGESELCSWEKSCCDSQTALIANHEEALPAHHKLLVQNMLGHLRDECFVGQCLVLSSNRARLLIGHLCHFYCRSRCWSSSACQWVGQGKVGNLSLSYRCWSIGLGILDVTNKWAFIVESMGTGFETSAGLIAGLRGPFCEHIGLLWKSFPQWDDHGQQSLLGPSSRTLS